MNQWKKRIAYLFATIFIAALHIQAADDGKENVVDIPFQKGTLRLHIMAENAVRVQYIEGEGRELPEWIYLPDAGTKKKRSNHKKETRKAKQKLEKKKDLLYNNYVTKSYKNII